MAVAARRGASAPSQETRDLEKTHGVRETRTGHARDGVALRRLGTRGCHTEAGFLSVLAQTRRGVYAARNGVGWTLTAPRGVESPSREFRTQVQRRPRRRRQLLQLERRRRQGPTDRGQVRGLTRAGPSGARSRSRGESPHGEQYTSTRRYSGALAQGRLLPDHCGLREIYPGASTSKA